jgi:hypothetical protein
MFDSIFTTAVNNHDATEHLIENVEPILQP